MISKHTVPTNATRWLVLAAIILLTACTGRAAPTPTFPAVPPTATTGLPTPTLVATGPAVTPADTAAPTVTLSPPTTTSASGTTPTSTGGSGTAPTAPPPDTSYEDLTTPASLLASFYNAINLKQYERAYSYLGENPTLPFDQFTQSYAGTAGIIPLIIPPTVLDGAAGSVYAQIPTFLLVTRPDGRLESLQGCTVTRFILPESGTESAGWHIYETDISPAAALQVDLPQLAQECPLPIIDTSRPPYHDRQTPTDVLASLYDAVNRLDFGRAYGYWEGLTVSNEEFADGYANTKQVIVAVIPPSFIGAAAGSMYAEIPTFLVATHYDGTLHPFQGCYVTRRSNQGLESDAIWWLYSANIQPAASATALDVQALDATCTAGDS